MARLSTGVAIGWTPTGSVGSDIVDWFLPMIGAWPKRFGSTNLNKHVMYAKDYEWSMKGNCKLRRN